MTNLAANGARRSLPRIGRRHGCINGRPECQETVMVHEYRTANSHRRCQRPAWLHLTITRGEGLAQPLDLPCDSTRLRQPA
eukprot:365214-Chlamydomonas_euryale.AAC.17